MIDTTIKKIIEKNPVALATCVNNKPHVIAVAFCKVIDNNQILITDNFMKTCKANLLKNNKVALAVWQNWQGYQLKGSAKYFKSGKWLKIVKKMKENKGYPAKGAIVVKVNKVIKLG